MLNYKSYKDRVIDTKQKVMVYKNLHNGLFSIRQNGLVVAHVESVTLYNVKFAISESGRQKVIREGQKNVHAFITGFIESVNNCFTINDKNAITYNPYRFQTFVYKNGLHDVHPTLAQKVYCSTVQGIYIH